LLAFATPLQKQAVSGQTDIFGNQQHEGLEQPKLELQVPAVGADSREQLLWERELLGLYLSQHPLELFTTILSEQTVPLNSLTANHDGKQVNIGGAIVDVREITTKNGQKMAFVKLEDRFGEIEAMLFPNSYQQTVGLWERDRVVLVRGKVNTRDKDGNSSGEVKIMVEDAREITSQQAAAYEATGKKPKVPKPKPKASKATAETVAVIKPQAGTAPGPINERLYIRLADTDDRQTLLSLKETIDTHQGNTEVVLVLGEAASKQAIKLPGGIDRAGDGLTKLQALVGSDNVVIQ
jgi:DNA polymerase III alpha subunit